MIGPPLPYNVHTNVHAVFHGIPAPPLDLLRFPPFPSSKDFKNFPDLEDRCVKFIALCVPSPPTKRGKLETCRASLDSYRTDVFFLSFFLSFFFLSLVFNKRGFRDTSRQDVTNRVCTEVSKRFLRPYLPTLSWFKAPTPAKRTTLPRLDG